jgi:iron-sulfur cluster repair protein YtfE (RIC family)
MADPVRQLEHTHGHLSKLVLDIGALVRSLEAGPARASWSELTGVVALLQREILVHFADEEEALFPFVRASVADERAVVDRLEAAHDAVCELLAQMARIAADERQKEPMLVTYERFGAAYAQHSADESALIDRLSRALSDAQKDELALRLRGVRGSGR